MTSDKSRSTEDRLNTMIPYTYATLNAHTKSITAVNTGSGGTAQENFLGSLQQAVAPSNPSHSGIGMIGHISAAPTQSDFNNLVDDYNATNTAFNNAVDTIATLISRLDATGILH